MTGGAHMAETKIFVCCHGKSLLPIAYSKPPFVLIGGGGYRDERVRVCDDSGDSIWQYNRYLNEATVLYWVANNYRPLPDFVGFAMYRHRLELSCGEPGTVICCAHRLGCSVRKQFCACHGGGLDELLVELKRAMPDCYDDFATYLDTATVLYRGNMFIMPKADFMEYADFLNGCVRVLIPLIGSLGVNRADDPRKCGYMFERLTGFWIWRHVRDGRAKLKGVRMLHLNLPRVPLSREQEVS